MTVKEYQKKYGGQPILVSPGVIEAAFEAHSGYISVWQQWEKHERGKAHPQKLTIRKYLWEDEGTCFRTSFDFLVCRDNGETYRKLLKKYNGQPTFTINQLCGEI